MKHRSRALLLGIRLAALLVCIPFIAYSLPAQALPDAPPQSAKQDTRASMQTMLIPSHGAKLNALAYVAAGAGPHPVVVLLHGFPGNERNLDLAQDMRRAGWDVVYFNYRGSWGTPGDFSFSHSMEDVASVLAYLRQADTAKALRLDPARIVLVGHSMGGFMTVQTAAHDPGIKAFALISAADMAGLYQRAQAKMGPDTALKATASGLANEGMAPLSGCTPDSLTRELADHPHDWPFLTTIDALKNRTALVITSDDGLAAPNQAFVDALRKADDTRVSTLHLPTDHAYSDQRIALSQALLKWLATLPQ